MMMELHPRCFEDIGLLKPSKTYVDHAPNFGPSWCNSRMQRQSVMDFLEGANVSKEFLWIPPFCLGRIFSALALNEGNWHGSLGTSLIPTPYKPSMDPWSNSLQNAKRSSPHVVPIRTMKQVGWHNFYFGAYIEATLPPLQGTLSNTCNSARNGGPLFSGCYISQKQTSLQLLPLVRPFSHHWR